MGPVSYTHLDVYKRQRLGLLIILQFDFIILPRFELWLLAECFTNVIILFTSLTPDSDIFDYKLIL